MGAYWGEVFALLTSLFWAGTSIFFTLAGREVGSQVVNRLRLLAATVCLSLIHWVLRGSLLPWAAEPARWGWLTVSAVVGLVIGDGLLFYAFTQIGARLSMLLMALTPVIGTFLAWLFLGETLTWLELLAVTITIGGIAWVILERAPANKRRATLAEAETPRQFIVGILCGVGGAAAQAAGLVLSKQGMEGGFFPLSASLMRVVTATLVIWALAALQREARTTVSALRKQPARTFILAGALIGPVIGMSLSLAAVQLSHVGIASTLMALSPVLLLPLGHWIFQDRVTLRAVLGTVVAMFGVALIFLG